jgi:hypothetical protein
MGNTASFDLSRSDVENLPSGFLSGALGAELIVRLNELDLLPRACRTEARLAEASGRGWVAWSTQYGPMGT